MTLSVNKQQERSGSLFQKNFKRKEIDSEDYFRKLVVYIHQNPIHHGFTDDFRAYSFSSYISFLNDEKSDVLNKKKVLELFGGIENFKAAHYEMILGKEFLPD